MVCIAKSEFYIENSLNPLFYSDAVNCTGKSHDVYLKDKSSQEILGRLVYTLVIQKINGNNLQSMNIDYLYSYRKNLGVGKALMDYAQSESENMNCHRLNVLSSSYHDKSNPPHVFYKKLGFRSKNPIINLYLEFCSKTGLKPIKALKNIKMYK